MPGGRDLISRQQDRVRQGLAFLFNLFISFFLCTYEAHSSMCAQHMPGGQRIISRVIGPQAPPTFCLSQGLWFAWKFSM